ncbi:uncharacterized protein F5Z01DRAFT_690857 [Emericellopsis atlantica]|uniref:Integral membrane protein n=1 Tax=Emericellopsis atlantica TaxID=2614577 RepID=A0A9P8CN07_9HYPO|nr:uncharacterized protein F5Z01DRAFT_690857 [Emericellopsis atlantica]KAG9252570.1 integral membrane protein [Emericellopsis atlantica]
MRTEAACLISFILVRVHLRILSSPSPSCFAFDSGSDKEFCRVGRRLIYAQRDPYDENTCHRAAGSVVGIVRTATCRCPERDRSPVGDPRMRSSASCSLTSVKVASDCICPNQTLQADLSACVQLACPFADQATATTLLGGLCAGYPVESRSTEVKVAIIACLVLTLFIVVMRCVARLTVSNRLWWDDWITILATAFFIGLCSVQFASANLGFGKHYWTVNAENAPAIFQLFYSSQILYVLVQVTAKVAILVLFGRIFPATWLQRAIIVFGVLLVAHGLIYMLLVILQCLPVHSIWDRSVQAKCVNITAMTFSGAILSIIEDIVIFALPIKEVFQLRLTMQKRIALVLMFSVGSFACVTSMVRLKYIVTFADSLDATWDNVDPVNWSVIEVACAIICGSLPTLRPLFRKVPGLLTSLKSRDGAKTLSTPRHADQPPSIPPKDAQLYPSAGPFEKLQNPSRFEGATWRVTSAPRSGQGNETMSSPSVNSRLEYELQEWTTEEKGQKVRAAV